MEDLEDMSAKHPFIIGEKSSGKRYRIPGFLSRQREGSDLQTEYDETSLKLSFTNSYLIGMFVFVIFIVVVITGRVVYLQLIQGETYRSLAESNRTNTERTVAPRGLFFDRNLTQLVKNHPRFNLKVVPRQLPRDTEERKAIIESILAGFEIDSEMHTELSDSLQNDILLATYNDPSITIAENIDYETALYFKLKGSIPGILLEQTVVREYTEGSSLSHVLGYLSKISPEDWDGYKDKDYYYADLVGAAGLEHIYEEKLRGNDAQVIVEVNSRGEEQRIVSQTTLEPGNNAILTIDAGLQKKMAEVLSRIARYESERAAAVAIDPNSGDILGLVSIPSYDNNIFTNGDNEALNAVFTDERLPLFNRTVNGTYPPGSTFKPVVAAAALEEGIVTPRKSFLSTGGLALTKWYFPDWKTGGHGWTNLATAIAESVNTYFYYVGGGYEEDEFVGLGVARINAYAQRFGFGNPLGVDLPSEQAGFLPTKDWKREAKGESWYVGDTYHLAIGQGDVLATPLQLASATAVFANHGILYQPRLVKSFTNKDGEIIEEFPPVELNRNPVSPEHIESVRYGLRQTVVRGSAQSMQLLPVTAAGKTGTAQIGGNKDPHSWFTVFAPYDRPEIVLVVLIEEGGEVYNSASVAAREILQWYFWNKK